MALTMEEWVQNEVYQYFGRNPLTAFEMYELKDFDLLLAIVVKYMKECPSEIYDDKYRYHYKLYTYMDLLSTWIKFNIKTT